MADSTDFSGGWNGQNGAINDINNYAAASAGSLSAAFDYGIGETIGNAFLQDGFPLSDAVGLSTIYAHFINGLPVVYAEVLGIEPPTGTIGPASQLGFGPTAAGPQPTTLTYRLDHPDDPPRGGTTVTGVVVRAGAASVAAPPNYTVSGSATVGSISTFGVSGAGNIGFTGKLTVGALSVTRVTTTLSGSGSVTLTPPPADSTLTGVAEVSDGGTLQFKSGATGTFKAAKDGLQVANGTVLVSGAGSMVQAQGLELGEITAGLPSTGTGTLKLRDGGVFNLTTGNGFNLYLGHAAGATGVIDASDAGSKLTVDGTITIGDAGKGTLTLASAATGQITGDTTLGAQKGGTGEIDLTGQGTALTVTGALDVGQAGMGTVMIGDGSMLTADSIVIGVGDSDTAMSDIAFASAAAAPPPDPVDPTTGLHTSNVSQVTNAGITRAGDLVIGQAGRAALTMTTGTLDVPGTTTIAEMMGSEGQATFTGGSWTAADVTVGAAGKAVLSISGGATAQANDVTIAEQASSNATATVGDKGTWTVNDLTAGDGGSGALVIDGGQVSVGGTLSVGEKAGSHGLVSVNGGKLLMTGGEISVGASGNGRVLFEQGGTLPGNGALSGPDLTLGENTGGSGSLTVMDKGTKVMLGTVEVGGSGTGSLTVTNAGELDNSGGADIADATVAKIQGVTISQGGVWKIGSGLSVGAVGVATLMVKTGGQVFAANDATIGNSAGASAVVTVTGTEMTGPTTVAHSSLGWGTSLTIGNFGVGTLNVMAGGIVAPETGGTAPDDGAVIAGGQVGGSGTVVVTGGTLKGTTLALGRVGATGRLTVGAGGLVQMTGAADVAATGMVTMAGGTFTAKTVTLDAGATLTGQGVIGGAVTDDGVIVAKGGVLQFSGALSGSGSATIQAGATLDIVGADTLRRVQFAGKSAVLDVGMPSATTAIAGFAATDTIDLVKTAGGVAGTVVGGTLVITNASGATVATLSLAGTYAGASFSVKGDGKSGTAITLAASQPGGGPAVTLPPVGVSTPQTIDAKGGAAVALTGLAVTDSNLGAIVTATLSAGQGVLAVGTPGTATVTQAAGGMVLMVSGTTDAVNAALASVTYTAQASVADTVSLSATDTAGDGDSGSLAIAGAAQTPGLTLPGAQTITAETATSITGLAVSSAFPDASITVTLSDGTGLLAAATVGGSEVDTIESGLVITGDLADVNADLASLTYQGASTGAASSVADTIQVSVDDGNDGTATGSIAVTVAPADDIPASIALPASPTLTVGGADAIAGIVVGDEDITGKSFTATLTADGALNVTAAGAATLTGAGTGTLTIAGSLADLNATLASLTETPAAPSIGVAGTDTLILTVADSLGASTSASLALNLAVPNGFLWSGADGAFGGAGNWQPAGPPGAADIAQFGSGSYTVTGDGTVGQVFVTGQASFTGTLTAAGISGDAQALVADAGGSAAFGAGSALVTQSTVVLGRSGAGSLTFDAGATATFDTTAQNGAAIAVDMGVNAGAVGTVTASGTGTTLSSDADWVIGDGGQGLVQLLAGAVATAGTGDASGNFSNTVLGEQASASGELDADGAGTRFDDAGALIVGSAGEGSLNVSNGAVVSTNAVAGAASTVLGFQAGSMGDAMVENAGALLTSGQNLIIGYDGTGSLEVFNGAGVEVDGTALRLGRDAGSSGSLMLTGAGSTLTADKAALVIGQAGMGSVTMGEGASGQVASLTLGSEAGGFGTLDIASAALNVAGAVDIDIGTLTLEAGSSVTPSVLTAQSVTIGAGGIIENDGTLNITNGLTLAGGTLFYDGDTPALTTAVTVAGGTAAAPSVLDGNLDITQAVTLQAGVALAIESVGVILAGGVDGFAVGDTLEFSQTAFGSPLASATWQDGTLSLFDALGNLEYSVLLPGDFSGDMFTLTPVGATAQVTVGPAFTPPPVFSWFGGTGNFATAADWSQNGAPGVPGSSDTAAFAVGGTLQGSGTVGAFQINSNVTFAGDFGAGGVTIDASGTLAITGIMLDASGLLVAGGTAEGTLAIGAGGTVTDTAFIEIGQGGISDGTITVSGAGAKLSDSGALQVGESGSGTLDVAAGGLVSAAFAEVGDQVGGIGSVDIHAGGSLQLGSLIIGNYGTGALTVEAGSTVTQTSFTTLGNTALAGNAVATVAGVWTIATSLDVGAAMTGTLDINVGGRVQVGGFTRLGETADGAGSISVSGTGASLDLGGALFIGDAGTGLVEVLAGGALDMTGGDTITLGNQSTGRGTLDITGIGSMLTAAGLALGNGSVMQVTEGASAGVSDVTNAGTVDVTGATLTARGTVTGTGMFDIGVSGTLSLGGAVGAAQGITFEDVSGRLDLADPMAFAGMINGFGGQDVIDLSTIGFAAEAHAAILDGTLTLTSGAEQASLALTGVADGTRFTAVDDGTAAHGVQVEEVACYVRGTRIAVPGGETAVEDLAIGDLVTVWGGGMQTIRWVGRRSYAGAFIAGNHLMLPVCITAGALADGVPVQDLHVSPGHAMWVDGQLVPAWRLVNGVSITQAASVDEVSYFHVELKRHDLLLANGAPAESFLDEAGFRGQFHNADEFDARYPDAAAMAPLQARLEDGFALQAVQERLAARAGALPGAGPAGALRGYVDQAGPERVCGWAQDVDSPEAPVTLEISADGAPMMCVLANAYRADLRSAGMGSGCHAFDVPLSTAVSGRIAVRRVSDGSELSLTLAGRGGGVQRAA